MYPNRLRYLHLALVLACLLALGFGRPALADDGDGDSGTSVAAPADTFGPVLSPYAKEQPQIQEVVGPFVDDVLLPGFAGSARLTPSVLRSQLQQGLTLRQIAAANGLYGERLDRAFLDAIEVRLQAFLTSGQIEAGQAAEVLDTVRQNLAPILDATYIDNTALSMPVPEPVFSGPSGRTANSRPIRVVATTVQIGSLAQEIGAEAIELTSVLPAGADPHEFEPVASDLRAIENAQLILRNGIGLDDWLDGTLEAGTNARLATVTGGVRLRQGKEDGRWINDPHVWHDPDNAARMADNVAAALVQVDPGNAGTYLNNADRFKRRLEQTKVQVQGLVGAIPAANRKLVTNHDALGYFANAFGLQVVGTVIPSLSTDAEPSAKDTAQLLETIRRERVKAIFAESSVEPRLARSIAKDSGVQVVLGLYADSLGEAGSGADTIDGMLLANARKISDALR